MNVITFNSKPSPNAQKRIDVTFQGVCLICRKCGAAHDVEIQGRMRLIPKRPMDIFPYTQYKIICPVCGETGMALKVDKRLSSCVSRLCKLGYPVTDVVVSDRVSYIQFYSSISWSENAVGWYVSGDKLCTNDPIEKAEPRLANWLCCITPHK